MSKIDFFRYTQTNFISSAFVYGHLSPYRFLKIVKLLNNSLVVTYKRSNFLCRKLQLDPYDVLWTHRYLKHENPVTFTNTHK